MLNTAAKITTTMTTQMKTLKTTMAHIDDDDDDDDNVFNDDAAFHVNGVHEPKDSASSEKSAAVELLRGRRCGS